MSLPQEKIFTTEDIYALPNDQRAELIDGQMYMMSPPNYIHQKITGELYTTINNYIKKKGGLCEAMLAPFAVFLDTDDLNYVEPDISVICDRSKLTNEGCIGAPDWIIEIVSPTTRTRDYGIKLFKYRSSGVREYWIVNPLTKTVNVYDFVSNEGTSQYGFEEEITVCIYEDFKITLSTLLKIE